MQKFNCKVMTPQGQIVNLKIEEENKISCLKKLKRNQMTPISIEPSFNFLNKYKTKTTATIYSRKNKNSILDILNIDVKLKKRVSTEEIKEFTIDLYTLRKSNFSTEHALLAIINKVENEEFKECLRDVLTRIQNGSYIYKSLKEHKNIFPLVYKNLIKTGELTNSLDQALEHAITYLEDEQKIKAKIKNTLIPNICMCIGIFVMLVIAVMIVIPNLQSILTSYNSGIVLPKYVTVLSKIITLIIKRWYILLFVIAVSFGIFIKYISKENGKYKFDEFKYKNKFSGKLAFLLDFSRIIKSIFLNLKNRMRLQDALEISKNVTKNTYLANLIEKSINNFYIGKAWLDVFEEEKILSPIVFELLKKGSKLRSIDTFDMGIKYLDKDIEKEIEKVLRRLSEISYITVGITLLIFVLTILLPCMQIYFGSVLFM